MLGNEGTVLFRVGIRSRGFGKYFFALFYGGEIVLDCDAVYLSAVLELLSETTAKIPKPSKIG